MSLLQSAHRVMECLSDACRLCCFMGPQYKGGEANTRVGLPVALLWIAVHLLTF